MSHGFFEAVVQDIMEYGFKAVNAGEPLFNNKFYQANILNDEVRELFADYGSKIALRVGRITENTYNEHRWAYKFTEPLNLIVWADPRDLIVETPEEIPFEPEDDCDYDEE